MNQPVTDDKGSIASICACIRKLEKYRKTPVASPGFGTRMGTKPESIEAWVMESAYSVSTQLGGRGLRQSPGQNDLVLSKHAS